MYTRSKQGYQNTLMLLRKNVLLLGSLSGQTGTLTLAKTQESDRFQQRFPSEAQQQLAHQLPWQPHLRANGQ